MNIGRWVNLSVDDVIECFHWVYQNQPISIFDEPMLAKIREWHIQYGLTCNLYVFEQCSEFSLEQLQECYWEELALESNWLKLAWHAVRPEKVADDDIELASLQRVYRLITEKFGTKLWAERVRLHRYQGTKKLLCSLSQLGIHTLLTPDDERSCYQLTEAEMLALHKKDYLKTSSFFYCRTDLRFDCIADGMTIEGLLAQTETLFAKRLWSPCIEIFFHEWNFDKIVSGIEYYWKNFGNIKIPLIANVGVQIGGKLYFTTCNTSALYAWDEKNKKVESVTMLPYGMSNNMKFSSIVYYNNNLWMIPWFENHIYVVNLISKKVEIFLIPFLKEEGKENTKFRKAVSDNQFLWLLPVMSKCLVKINMEKRTVDIISEWPMGVEFDKGKVNFKVMKKCDRKLYLFKDGCSHNIVVDMDTCKMSIWNVAIVSKFGELIDKNELLISPVERNEPVKIINLKTSEEKDFYLPECNWQEGNGYAFWYTKRLDNHIYIFPHDADTTLCYNIHDMTLSAIRTEITDYCTQRPISSYAVYDVFQNDEERWLFPFMGNVIVRINGDGNMIGVIRLFEDLQQAKISNVENGIVYEDADGSLNDYINAITDYKISNWTCIIENGRMISMD